MNRGNLLGSAGMVAALIATGCGGVHYSGYPWYAETMSAERVAAAAKEREEDWKVGSRVMAIGVRGCAAGSNRVVVDVLAIRDAEGSPFGGWDGLRAGLAFANAADGKGFEMWREGERIEQVAMDLSRPVPANVMSRNQLDSGPQQVFAEVELGGRRRFATVLPIVVRFGEKIRAGERVWPRMTATDVNASTERTIDRTRREFVVGEWVGATGE